MTGPEGNKTEYTYDDNSNVLTTTQKRPDQSVVAVTSNTYEDNKLKTTEITEGAEVWLRSENIYDATTKKLLHTKRIDPTGTLDNVITSYWYSKADSGSPDQPYSVSEPYAEDGTPQYNRFFYYDENGNQEYSLHEWEDPEDADAITDRWVYSFNDLDAQGRTFQTRRVVDIDDTLDNGNETETILGQTWYNQIGRADITISETGQLTKYEYDETGNLVETLTFVSQAAYEASDDPLTISRTLYDAAGRVIVSVGPYDPLDTTTPNYPVGTETVYDELGRVVETRRWASVAIDMVDLVVNGAVVGRTVNPDPAVTVRNAWGSFAGETGDPPAELTNIGWTAGGALPVAGNELSYSRSVYDIAGRVKHSVTLARVWDQTVDGGSGAYVIKEQPTTYQYDYAGRQVAVIDPLGHDLGGLYEYADEINDIWVIDFDSFDESTHLTGTHRTETEYVGTRRDYVTDANGETTSFVYDDLGRIITTIHPRSDFTEDIEGVVTSYTDELSYTHVGYDGLGRKAWQAKQTATSDRSALIDAVQKKRFEYDVAGRLERVTLPRVYDGDWVNPQYRYIYDAYGNQVCIVDPKGRLTVFQYNEMSQQTVKYMPFEVADPGAIIDAEDVYDALPDPLPASESRSYDDFGRLDWSKDYEGQITGYFYNDLGQMYLKQYYDEAVDYPNNSAEEVEYIYDNLGRRYQMIEDDGVDVRTTTYFYNAEGNVIQIDAPEGIINYEYDPVTGRKIKTYTDLTETQFTYDELGRLKETKLVKRDGSTITPEVTTYNYNEVGSREDVILDNGITTHYNYDAMNRLEDMDHKNSLQEVLGSHVYGLYADGMRSGVTEELLPPVGTLDTYGKSYTYGALNRLTQEVSNDGTDGYTANYKYDLVGNRLERHIVSTDGLKEHKIVYDYDNPTTTDDDGMDQLYQEIISNPLQVRHEGEYPVYVADSGGEGADRVSWLPIPSKLWKPSFYVALAAIPTLLILPLFGGLFRRNNKRRRLKIKSLLARGLCLMLAFMFLFDPFSLQTWADQSSYYSTLNDRMEKIWGQYNVTITYLYDDNGSMVSKDVSGGTDPHTVTYDYNYQNRLSKVTETRGVTDKVTEFFYNVAGIRVQKVENPGEATEKTTYYLVDSTNHTGYAQVLEEETWDTHDVTPVFISRTTYTVGDDIIGHATDGTVKHYLYDGHGSVRQHTDANGDLITYQYGPGEGGPDPALDYNAFHYDGYGNSLIPQSNDGLYYAGEMWDSHADHYYNRARYYNPSNGRFNRLDPYAGSNSDPQSLHKYLYCHANPVNGIDPSGNFMIGGFSISGLALTVAILSVVTVTGLTIYNGIRHKLSASAIVWQVVKNLAVFACIIGAIFLSGFLATAAALTLVATFIDSVYSLYKNRSNMDTTDWVITGITFLCFLAFAGAVGTAAPPPTPSIQPGKASVLPESYFSRTVVDMRNAPARSGSNAAGFPRSGRWFFRQLRDSKPEYFSEGNLKAIARGKAPKVDHHWVRHHPAHRAFMGEKLTHHHIGQGPYAVAVPEPIHVSWTQSLHPNTGQGGGN